jgi:NADPH:quinone reductase-like Zn-dependent oxidoreductase
MQCRLDSSLFLISFPCTKAWKAQQPDANRENVEKMLELIKNGTMSPTISKVFPLADCVLAFDMIMNRKAIGKIVISVHGQSRL